MVEGKGQTNNQSDNKDLLRVRVGVPHEYQGCAEDYQGRHSATEDFPHRVDALGRWCQPGGQDV